MLNVTTLSRQRDRLVVKICNWLINHVASKEYSQTLEYVIGNGLALLETARTGEPTIYGGPQR